MILYVIYHHWTAPSSNMAHGGNKSPKALHKEVGSFGKLGALLWILEEIHYIFSILQVIP